MEGASLRQREAADRVALEVFDRVEVGRKDLQDAVEVVDRASSAGHGPAYTDGRELVVEMEGSGDQVLPAIVARHADVDR